MESCRALIVQRLSLSLASREMVYFSKWIYRHRNQLRRDKSFQRLLQIEKLIKRYLNLNIVSTTKQTMKDILDSSDRVVPSSQLTLFLNQLCDCTLYNIRLLKLMEITFIDLYQRIETCHLLYAFMIITSSLSRLWFYVKKHVWVLCDVQFRLLENVRQHSDISYDLSRIMTKDNMEYLPLKMRESLRKEDGKSRPCTDLVISSELQALRERDMSSVSISKRKALPLRSSGRSKKKMKAAAKGGKKKGKKGTKSIDDMKGSGSKVTKSETHRKGRTTTFLRRKGKRRHGKKVRIHCKSLEKLLSHSSCSSTIKILSIHLRKHSMLNKYFIKRLRISVKRNRKPTTGAAVHKLQKNFLSDINEACDNHVTLSQFLAMRKEKNKV